MKIEVGCLVSLKVTMRDARGALLEQSGERPLVYLHGADDIFPRIEAALAGRQAGYTTTLALEPQDAFGDDDPALLHLVPLARLGADVDIGMRVEGVPDQPADGRIYTVVDLADEVAVLDGNHPLAGRALIFDIEVLGVEPAGDAALAQAERAPAPEFLSVGAQRVDRGTRH